MAVKKASGRNIHLSSNCIKPCHNISNICTYWQHFSKVWSHTASEFLGILSVVNVSRKATAWSTLWR